MPTLRGLRRRDQPVIHADGLAKRFGDVHALQDLNLTVPPGTGAGKTTTLRILTTLLHPDTGHAQVAGLDVVRHPRRGTADDRPGRPGRRGRRIPHRPGEPAHGRPPAPPAPVLGPSPGAELLQRFELAEAAERPVRTWSGGMRRRLDLAVSLVGHPRVLFLDEPSSGLDPRGRHQLWQTIRPLVDADTAVLLTTQYLEEADQLANQIVVIDHGRTLAHGTSDQLKAQVGGDRLQLRLATPDTASRAAELVADLGSGSPQVDTQTGQVTVPIADGVAVLPEVVRRLDAAGLGLSDLAMRRPTLDDVFLALTGHTTQPPNPSEAPTTDQPRPERQPATRSPA